MRIWKIAAAGALAAGMGFAAAPKAEAAYIITLEQVGANVVATGSGSIDLAGLTAYALSEPPLIVAETGSLLIGSGATVSYYGYILGPSDFGSGGLVYPNSFSGVEVGVISVDALIVVPNDYVSGAQLGTSTATWDDATLAGLGGGITPGTYTWILGAGPEDIDDSLTLIIEAPEPASLAVLATGLVGLGVSRHRRKAR